MNCLESVRECSYEPSADEQNPRFPRKAVDPDAALVRRLRRHDAGAVEVLVGAYGGRVHRLAMRITGNASDAEEVVQDALWTASRKIDTFREAAAFGSWIYRITANKAYEKLRGRQRKRNEVSWEDLGPSFGEKDGDSEVVADWARRLRDPASEAELKSVLGDVIDQLPEDQRTAFLLHDVEGLSNPRIAETLHITLGTSKSRVRRARLFLRRRLADYVDERVDVAPEQALRSPRFCGGRRAGHLAPDLPPAIVWKYLTHVPHAAEGPS